MGRLNSKSELRADCPIREQYYLNSTANTRPGVARFTEDWENLFFSRKKGFTTEMYLSIVRVTVRYTLDVIVVFKCRHYEDKTKFLSSVRLPKKAIYNL